MCAEPEGPAHPCPPPGERAPDGSLVFVGQNGAAVLTADDGETFVDLHADLRRGLYGVAPAPGGAVMVTGEGGSSPLALSVNQQR